MNQPSVTMKDVKRIQQLSRIYTATEHIRGLEKRNLTLTRCEAIKLLALTKQELKKLEDEGFIKMKTEYIADRAAKKNLGARVLVYLTPQGADFCKKHFTKDKADG